jgi:cytosine deaminase
VVRPNQSGTLTEAIEIIWEKKRTYTDEDIYERASRTVLMAVQNGVTRMRSHVDVDNIGELRPARGVLAVKERMADVVDIECVAFPQEGILKNPGAEALMRQAMRMGCAVVGGMPANELTPRDSQHHVEICFTIAQEFNADVDMHVDETDDPFYRTLEMVADETIRRGWEGRVTCGHTCALAAYDDPYAANVMEKVKAAGINMITNPATNLMLQGRGDGYPKRRGLTRVKELVQAGINVSFGQDCVRDTFYPFGSADPMQVALILCHAAHMSLPAEIEQVFDMPTVNAAKLLRLSDWGLAPGKRADLVMFDCQDPREAIQLQPSRLYTVRRGRIVAEAQRQSRVHRRDHS